MINKMTLLSNGLMNYILKSTIKLQQFNSFLWLCFIRCNTTFSKLFSHLVLPSINCQHYKLKRFWSYVTKKPGIKIVPSMLIVMAMCSQYTGVFLLREIQFA